MRLESKTDKELEIFLVNKSPKCKSNLSHLNKEYAGTFPVESR